MNERSPTDRRHWGIAAVLTATFLAAVLAALWWRHTLRPLVPLPDLANVDPEIAKAITQSREEVLGHPKSAQAWGKLGMVYRAHDFGKEAEPCFVRAEQLDARDPRWPYLQGLTLLLSEPEQGIACITRAVDLCDDVAPRLRLAEALLDSGCVDDAEQQIVEAERIEPSNPRAALDRARIAVLRQQWSNAQASLKQCQDEPHAQRQAAIMGASLYRHLGDPAKAAASEKQAAALPEDLRWPDPFVDPVLALQRGYAARMAAVQALIRSGEFQSAESLLAETALRYPDQSLPWLRLADIRRSRGDNAGGEEACRQATRADPDDAQAWFGLGCFQALSHDSQEAARSFRQAISLKPDHALAHFNLGHRLKELGDLSGAAGEFRSALQCQPDYREARQALESIATPEQSGPVSK